MKKIREYNASDFSKFALSCHRLFEYNKKYLNSFLERHHKDEHESLLKWFEKNAVLNTDLDTKVAEMLVKYLDQYEYFFGLARHMKVTLDGFTSEFDGLIKQQEDLNNEKH